MSFEFEAEEAHTLGRLLRQMHADKAATGRIGSLDRYRSIFGDSAFIEREYRRIMRTLTPEAAPTEDEGTFVHIGPYRAFEEVGRGAQSIVYRARDEVLGRIVALKVLASMLTHDADGAGRLRREAQAVARLRHPGIAEVFDVGASEGQVYLAMRFVPGKTLAACRRALPDEVGKASIESLASALGRHDGSPVDRIASWFEDCAHALDAAHEAGLVHRDVKPANLMVGPDGEATVLDFGLVQDEDSTLSMTATNALLGTPRYMAPEQIVAEQARVDRRADVWALGICLHEWLTQQAPFEGPTREATLRSILYEEPLSADAINPEVPRDLAIIVQTALDKDLGRRYQTARDLAEDLRRLREHRTILARPAGPATRLKRWSRRHRGVAVLLTVVIFVLSGSAALFAWMFREQVDLVQNLTESRRDRLLDGATIIDGTLSEFLAPNDGLPEDRSADAMLGELRQHWGAFEQEVDDSPIESDPALARRIAIGRAGIAGAARRYDELCRQMTRIENSGDGGIPESIAYLRAEAELARGRVRAAVTWARRSGDTASARTLTRLGEALGESLPFNIRFASDAHLSGMVGLRSKGRERLFVVTNIGAAFIDANGTTVRKATDFPDDLSGEKKVGVFHEQLVGDSRPDIICIGTDTRLIVVGETTDSGRIWRVHDDFNPGREGDKGRIPASSVVIADIDDDDSSELIVGVTSSEFRREVVVLRPDSAGRLIRIGRFFGAVAKDNLQMISEPLALSWVPPRDNVPGRLLVGSGTWNRDGHGYGIREFRWADGRGHEVSYQALGEVCGLQMARGYEEPLVVTTTRAKHHDQDVFGPLRSAGVGSSITVWRCGGRGVDPVTAHPVSRIDGASVEMRDLWTGDVDGDGLDDIVAVCETPARNEWDVLVGLISEDGNLRVHRILSNVEEAEIDTIVLANIDGDADLEIIAGAGDRRRVWGLRGMAPSHATAPALRNHAPLRGSARRHRRIESFDDGLPSNLVCEEPLRASIADGIIRGRVITSSPRRLVAMPLPAPQDGFDLVVRLRVPESTHHGCIALAVGSESVPEIVHVSVRRTGGPGSRPLEFITNIESTKAGEIAQIIPGHWCELRIRIDADRIAVSVYELLTTTGRWAAVSSATAPWRGAAPSSRPLLFSIGANEHARRFRTFPSRADSRESQWSEASAVIEIDDISLAWDGLAGLPTIERDLIAEGTEKMLERSWTEARQAFRRFQATAVDPSEADWVSGVLKGIDLASGAAAPGRFVDDISNPDLIDLVLESPGFHLTRADLESCIESLSRLRPKDGNVYRAGASYLLATRRLGTLEVPHQ